MPNWCENTLTVEGSAEDTEKFYKENRSDTEDANLLFSKSVPHKEPQIVDYADIWGTKWDLNENTDFETSTYRGHSSLYYTFETAWSPPDNWLKAVIKKYPELSFYMRYTEPASFTGIITGSDGKVDRDECIDY